MELQRPIYWHQGLFLQPQHFQLSDRGAQALLIPYQEYLTPHFWGVSELLVQKASLGMRSFQLSGGKFVFPDGTYVVLPGNALIESRTFDESWVDGGKPFTVYAGIKKWNNAGGNVTAVESLENLSRITTRFVAPADDEPYVDLHAGGPQGVVKRLYFVLKLFWETELDQAGEYELVPVAQLERTREGIDLSMRFIPPSLSIAGCDLLFSCIKEIRDHLASRSRQLEEYKRQRGVQASEFGSRDVAYLLALRSLNRYVPLLFHYCQARQVPPWHVYGILRQLIGELSTFSDSVTVLGESVGDNEQLVPDYDHRNLGECFNSAHMLILKLLDEITAGPEYVIPLQYDGTYFASELKPAHFEGRNRYYLVLKTEEDPKLILQYVSTVAKLSSRERLAILIARALPGISLEYLPNPPQELPRRSFSHYFSIDSHDEQWALVNKGNNIALYWDDAPEDLTVELMIAGRS